jgi:hypothetical protein
VEIFAEGASLIAAARISGHGAVYGLKTAVTGTGEKTVAAVLVIGQRTIYSTANSVNHI